ncbi:MAG TPA: threonine/serine dehydratase [Steroidobacteraceae bacterium]|nr:threonine/serine dehydratase [Steroidobacteraceae bacterium]
MKTLPEFDDVLAAARRIADWVRHTPVLRSDELDARFGARLFFKCENLQRVGAFKFRGAANAVRLLDEAQRQRGVATHSSGNHGAALALAAQLSGLPAVVVMPDNSAAPKKAAVARYGAEIVYCAPGRVARERTLAEVVERTGAEVIHPYNDDRVIAGQGTAALELLAAHPEIDVVMAPVGGGGLLSGTALAARGQRRRIDVIGVEPAQADDAWRSFTSGTLVQLDAPDTIADGLRASLGDRTFAVIRRHVDQILRVTDDQIVAAMRLVYEELRIVIEPSCAVPVAAILGGQMDPRGRTIGVILTGGNVDLDRLPWQAARE